MFWGLKNKEGDIVRELGLGFMETNRVTVRLVELHDQCGQNEIFPHGRTIQIRTILNKILTRTFMAYKSGYS